MTDKPDVAALTLADEVEALCPCRDYAKNRHRCCGNLKADPECCTCCPKYAHHEYYDCDSKAHDLARRVREMAKELRKEKRHVCGP